MNSSQSRHWHRVFSVMWVLFLFSCVSSFHVFGATPIPASGAYSFAHQQECVGGHTYWSCDVSELMLHGSRVCPTSGCGQTYSDCLNTSTSCVVGGYHASAALSETLALVSIIAANGVCMLYY